MFSSLAVRGFRIYLIGMFLSLCGTWIQAMAQNWLVFELSGSSFILGLLGFVNYSPILLFSLFFGVLVDRCNKRHLLLFSQISFMCLAFLLAYLTQTKTITVNMLLLISLAHGVVLSLDAPARQAIVVELVGKPRILNAIALNSIAFHGARMIGPALAGVLVALINVAGCFYVNAFSFLTFIFALVIIAPAHNYEKKNNGHFFEDLKEGIVFVKNHTMYLFFICIVATVSLFGFSYVVLMPVYAKTILHVGVKGYGFLMSASGIGSLLGGVMLASLKSHQVQKKILMVSLVLFSTSLIAFSLVNSFIAALCILVCIGFFSLSILTIVNSLIQNTIPDKYRGRIMSIYMITFAGTIPFGSLLAGALSESLGVQVTLFCFGLVCMVIFLGVFKKLLTYDLSSYAAESTQRRFNRLK